MSEAQIDFTFLVNGGAPVQRYEAGAKIFVEGDDGRSMYAVKSGKVRIISGGTVLGVVGPNGLFGEMALIDGAPRTATALAVEPTEIAAIDRETFLGLVREKPGFALDVMRLLAARLRRMNEHF